jgi:hypothetical protein
MLCKISTSLKKMALLSITWEMPSGVGVNLACVSAIHHPHSHFQLPAKYVAWFMNLLHHLNQPIVLRA